MTAFQKSEVLFDGIFVPAKTSTKIKMKQTSSATNLTFGANLVGGWTTPSEKYARQNGFIFPNFRDANKKNMKPPPRSDFEIISKNPGASSRDLFIPDRFQVT